MTFGRRLLAVALIVAPVLITAVLVAPGLAQAQDGSGCGGFKWPLDHELAALVRADKALLPNGGALAYDVPITLELQPLAGAGLPKAPERAPKSPSDFRGAIFRSLRPTKPGVYRVTINPGGWVDVLDGGAFLHPIALAAQRDARAPARASSSTCRAGRSRFSLAASPRIKSPSSFRPSHRSYGRFFRLDPRRAPI